MAHKVTWKDNLAVALLTLGVGGLTAYTWIVFDFLSKMLSMCELTYTNCYL